MQIDTQPLQVNARRLNVPRVLYGVGGTAVSYVSILKLFTNLMTQNVRDGGWNVVGKQFSSPKTFNTWAVIDFVGDKLDISQISERVHALSICCQQLGKFFFRMNRKPIANFARHGYGNIIVAHIYTHHLLLQALPLPLSRSNGAFPSSRTRYTFLHLFVSTFSNSLF